MRNLDLIEFVQKKARKKYNLTKRCSKNYKSGWLGEAVFIADTDIEFNESTKIFAYCWFDNGTGGEHECIEVIDFDAHEVIERMYFKNYEEEFGERYIY